MTTVINTSSPGFLRVSAEATVQLDDEDPVLHDFLIELPAGSSGVPITGGWKVLNDEQTEPYDGALSAIWNADSSVDAGDPESASWLVRLRFEPAPGSPQVVARAYATFVMFAKM